MQPSPPQWPRSQTSWKWRTYQFTISGWPIETTHHPRTLFPSVHHVGSRSVFTMRSTWRRRSLMTVRLYRYMSFVRMFHFGRRRGRRWSQIFWRKDRSCWSSSCSLSRRSAQRAAISKGTRQARWTVIRVSTRDMGRCQSLRNNSRPKGTVHRTTQ